MLDSYSRSTARTQTSTENKIQAGTKPNLDTTPDPRVGTAVKK